MSTYKFNLCNERYQYVECNDPFNFTKEESIKFVEDFFGQSCRRFIDTYGVDGTIIFKGIRPDPAKTNSNISTNEDVFYFSNSPIVAASYTMQEKSAFICGILSDSKKQIDDVITKRSDKGAIQMDNIANHLRNGLWIETDGIDMIKCDCDQVIIDGNQNETVVKRLGQMNQPQSQVIVHADCIWFDLLKFKAYPVKKLWDYYKV
jgi:hypothetical protein